MTAFITGSGVCLPNDPLSNDQIEGVLGTIDPQSATIKDIILQRNGIKSRHYVIDPSTGRQTHTNAQLTVEAIYDLVQKTAFDLDTLEVLACGTSLADQLIPSHASMVHGLLGCPPCELATTTGVCCSGMTALKYGAISVLSGTAHHAVVTGSEVASTALLARNYRERQGGGEDDAQGVFNREFLRWMLSDGAGALLIEGQPRSDRASLRIDWIDILSFANELETCMYAGALKAPDGSLQTWREVDHLDRAWNDGFFHIAQDARLLNETILPVAMKRSLERVRARRQLEANAIDWLLPHLSSYFFRQPIHDTLAAMGFPVPLDKWFTNLETKGNTGSASIYIMLDELLSSGRLKSGERLLCVVPESARFLFAYMHLTVL
jgi:3-oxoacyl-[acyl-carrier-protein] synthase-3